MRYFKIDQILSVVLMMIIVRLKDMNWTAEAVFAIAIFSLIASVAFTMLTCIRMIRKSPETMDEYEHDSNCFWTSAVRHSCSSRKIKFKIFASLLYSIAL